MVKGLPGAMEHRGVLKVPGWRGAKEAVVEEKLFGWRKFEEGGFERRRGVQGRGRALAEVGGENASSPLDLRGPGDEGYCCGWRWGSRRGKK